MYDKFTARARKTMFLANQEAQRLQGSYIGTEHILLGLLKEGSGVAAHVLQDRNLDLRLMARQIELLARGGGVVPAVTTPSAKRVIEYAIEEARKLKHDYVGTEHILLGLVREQKGVAAQVLANCGLGIEELRASLGNVLNRPYDWGRKQGTPPPPLPPPLDDHTKQVVEQPKRCPKCGAVQVVRIVWNTGRLTEADQEDLLAGKAIFASRSEGQGPPWVCLRCMPVWADVELLSLQVRELQIRKEKAAASTDFEEAARCRDRQTELQRQVHALVQALLRTD